MLDLSRYYKDFSNITIDRPIFLLGTQGGGLTLISRMLRRNKQVISVTGNHKYWSGADEMQNVLGPLLPKELTGIKHKIPPDDEFGSPRGWLYAVDKMLPKYRSTNEDVTPCLKEHFRKVLRWTIARHKLGPETSRFTDKSQLYTIKVSFLNELLQECKPYFVLITRNPYAVGYRAAKGRAPGLHKKVRETNFKYGLELAAQHWENSVRLAMKDGKQIENFTIFRFEDILQEPKTNIKKMCDFLELEFNEDMLPQPEHDIPFGSRFYDRWYPLRPDVNQKYIRKITKEEVKVIKKRCGELASQFGYYPPV